MSVISIHLDRVGAVYQAGESVTGVVRLRADSATSVKSVQLKAEGTMKIEPSSRSQGIYDQVYQHVKPVTLMSAELELAKSVKLPAGETAIPFSFPLTPAQRGVPLPETYHGVYIKIQYSVNATVAYMFSQKPAEPVTLLVYSPGQSMPTEEELIKDDGMTFELNSSSVRASRKCQGPVPRFTISGAVTRYYNDIEVPLSGYVCIRECNLCITSVEIQLIRSECVATTDAQGKENTEVQNIQIGDGDVQRDVVIPMHMMFPRWYTCATMQSSHLRVEFEVNLVVTLEGHTQITQNMPIKLYRAVE